MTTMFEERERAAEALFALDEELRFLALARRNKMLGAWMCERLNLAGREAEAYKSRLVETSGTSPAPGRTADEALVERLRADLAAKGAAAEADALPGLIARYGAEAARTVREQARES
ncbi:ATPase inhibitor subunit zeta [Methylobacterium sp. Gmos1]